MEGPRGAGRGRYPFGKMRKSQEQYTHTKIKFYQNFCFYDGY